MSPVSTAAAGLSTLDCFGRIFDALGFGTIVIGDDWQILHANRLAVQHVGAGISVASGRLAATDPASDRVLQSIIGEHLEDGDRTRNALGLSRLEQRPLILRIVALADEVRPVFEGAKLVAVLVDPEVCPEPSQGLLQQIFGLTRREAHVAIRLICGLTLHEMAKESGVSVGTIRAQTKAIFAKTGTSRQAELVGLLTRLAAISHGT